jgi:drug/metabolite transporter (DMT)-like permease
VASKTVSSSGLVISFYRLWFAVPALWLVPLFSPAVRSRLDRDWLRASIVGGLLFGIHQVFFFTSLKATSIANVSIIGSLQPVLVLLVAGRMFGETVGRRALLWSAVALLGTAIVVVGSHGTPGWSPSGDVLATFNLFAFTFYFLASKRIRIDVRPTEYVIGMTTVSALFMLAVCLVSGQDWRRRSRPTGRCWSPWHSISGTLGHLLTNWAHAHTSAFVISIMFLGTPVLASVGAAVLPRRDARSAADRRRAARARSDRDDRAVGARRGRRRGARRERGRDRRALRATRRETAPSRLVGASRDVGCR